MIKRIVVNRHHVRHNKTHEDKKPVLSLQTYKGVERANEIVIDGPCRVIYRPNKPLKCGATVWIETEERVDAN